jgi:hypothetical protein
LAGFLLQNGDKIITNCYRPNHSPAAAPSSFKARGGMGVAAAETVSVARPRPKRGWPCDETLDAAANRGGGRDAGAAGGAPAAQNFIGLL